MEGIVFKGVECAHCGLKQDVIRQVEGSRMEDQGGGHRKNIYYLKRENHICAGCGATIEWISDRASINFVKKGS